MFENYYSIEDLTMLTGRTKHTIWYHVKSRGLGTMKAGRIFLNTKEKNIIVKAIEANRSQYDKAVETRRKSYDESGNK